MKIQDIMNRPVETCGTETDLSAAAMIMWRQDCGVVPVVNEQRGVLGVVTDRDLCMAVATRHRRAEELSAGDVMSHRLLTVHPEDDVHLALKTMSQERVRRLPVVDAEERLVGIVSINDLVLAARPGAARGAGDLTANQVIDTLRAICAHPVPMQMAGPPREEAHV